jgi:hypothetical protein
LDVVGRQQRADLMVQCESGKEQSYGHITGWQLGHANTSIRSHADASFLKF